MEDKLSIIGDIALLLYFLISAINWVSINRINDNLIDIDKRLTQLEQEQHNNDTIHVNMYQHINENAYNLKLHELGIYSGK